MVIGGNGSQSGSASLAREGFAVVGVPSTIDNDLYGNDVSIGCDTAINITLEAIDRLRTTASSHQRAFAVETMGRDCGYIALMAGIAGGAEVIALPESEIQPAEVAERLRDAYRRGKTHALAVIAEELGFPLMIKASAGGGGRGILQALRKRIGEADFWVQEDIDDSPGASGGPVRLILTVGDPDAVFRRALAAGATEIAPVSDDHGWHLGRLVDPFGHHWEVGRPLADAPG